MTGISESHRERDAVYALITFKRKGKQYEEKNSNAFFPVYVGIVDAALAIDPAIRVEWHGPYTWDPVAQCQDIQQLIARQADGIIVTAAGATALNSAINDAIRAGIPVINFDADAPESDRLTFVGTNNFKAGYRAGQAMAEWLAGQGNVLVANIPNADQLEARVQGFLAAMREFAPQSSVYVSNEMPSAEAGETQEHQSMRWRNLLMRKIQEFPDIRGVFMTFGESGSALIDAIDALHRQDVIQGLVFDVDATAIKLVGTDRLRGVIEQEMYLMGYISMILAHAARQSLEMPTKHDGRWRIAALQNFLKTHPYLLPATAQKLRAILQELDAQTPTYPIDTGIQVLGKMEILDVVANDFENMRESLSDKIDALGNEIQVRTRAERELRLLNEQLEQRVKERTAEIARQKYILDTFMANVPDSIYFKDRESRITHANLAHARSMGFYDPSEEMGKSDFDFFPEELARSKYEQEQAIMQTGQPLLALEEPDAQGRWSLTTKMPLRDEHGEIIGTFGISRDITPLKQAQHQVEDAYVEIQKLNEQLRRENLRMSAELDVARRLQQMVLPMPEELCALSGLEIVGYMQPAAEVGGDYYDVLPCQRDGHVCIGIGDVTGHGLESGVLMLMTQTAIRTLIDRGETDPVIFLNTLNRVLYQNIQRMGVDRSLTLAIVNYQEGQLRLIGQHEEALIVRHDGKIERMDTIDLGFPLGMVDDIRQWVAETTVTLCSGDGLILYTDGITEAQNAAGEFYGLERLCAVISANWREKNAEYVKQAIVDDLRAFVGGAMVYDDVTLVVLKQQ